MSTDYQINAEPRTDTGKAASRRFRREGKIPAVVYGAGKDNVSLLLDHHEIFHKLETEGFHSAIIKIHTGKSVEQAILRDVQMDPVKPNVVHVDFQRVSASEKLHIAVPIHFIGEEDAPGVKTEHGIMSHMINEVDVSCLPADLPEYLEVDVSGMSLGDAVHLSDIKVPEGVELTALLHEGEDHIVATVYAPQIDAEAEEAEEAEAAAAEEAEEGEAEDEEGDESDEDKDDKGKD
ncbi:MAG: 50S ribosomal protein L25/general stress protein Ctc [Gammaproteobacteria bacterium]|nr:50S ribosomal protein L25/general stress protein Ctc [Gammaproteobacteria bacterium]